MRQLKIVWNNIKHIMEPRIECIVRGKIGTVKGFVDFLQSNKHRTTKQILSQLRPHVVSFDNELRDLIEATRTYL